MIFLGVDPGLRHLGVAVLADGVVVEHFTSKPPGRGKVAMADAFHNVHKALGGVCDRYAFDAAAVEQVSWYGMQRRILLPLSHAAGACIGYLLGRGLVVYSLLANQRRPIEIPQAWQGKEWDEHQRDAAALATVLQRHYNALAAGDPSASPSRSAVARRAITVAKKKHGKR